jgi:hypothetical protein
VFMPVSTASARTLTARRISYLLMCIAGLVVGFVIGYPNILINPAAFVKDISFLWVRVGAGYEGWRIVPDSSPLFYLMTLDWGVGAVMLTLSAVGLIEVAVRRTVNGLLLISFPLTYFVAMSFSRGHFGRYMLPILPFLAVLTADVCLSTLPDLLGRLPLPAARLRPTFWGFVALLAVVVPNAGNSLRLDWLLSQPDTRTVAKQWIEANLAAGTRIAVEWPYHTPPLSNGYTVPPNSQREYWIDLVWGFGLADRPIEQYQTDGTQFIIATSYIRQIPTEDVQQEARRQQFYARLPQFFREVKRFSPRCDGSEPAFIFDQIYGPAIDLWNLCQPGPLITLYQVKP